MKDGFQGMIDRYGSPHRWGKWEWWINTARLISEWIAIRVIIDVATRCPDEILRTAALRKLRDEFEAARLRRRRNNNDAANREDTGPVDVAHHEGGGDGD